MIPPGFVKIDHRLPKKGEWALFGNSPIKAPWNYTSLTMDILVPDNLPPDWEFVDYREAKKGESYLGVGGMVYGFTFSSPDPSKEYVIVQRKQKETKEMTIPYGFVKGETRFPKEGEWYTYEDRPIRALFDFCEETYPILTPTDIPSGWEFVDYRLPKKGENYLWKAEKYGVKVSLSGEGKEKLVIVRKKVKTEAETLLEEISKLSYTPPPAVPTTITPAGIYGKDYLKGISENLTKEGWEVIGFRIPDKGDRYVYDLFGKDIRLFPDPVPLEWPALIVRKKRVITDTERLDYFLSECAMFENREEIDKAILEDEEEERGGE